MGWGSAPRSGRFTPGKDPVPIVQEAGWAPGPVWTGSESLASTGIRSPDRPARSESLYRLRYPGRPETNIINFFSGLLPTVHGSLLQLNVILTTECCHMWDHFLYGPQQSPRVERINSSFRL